MAGGLIPPTSKAILQVCSMAGIDLITQKKTRLIKVKGALENSIKEAQQAKNSHDTLSRMLLAANLIKASCDAFISMAGDLGDAAGIKGAGKVSSIYSGVSKSAETASQVLNGQKFDALGTANALAKTALATANFGKGNEALKDVGDLKTIQVDIINSAVQNDKPGVLKNIFLSYIPKLTSMSLNYIRKETAAKFVGLGTSIAKSAADFSSELEKAFDQKLDDEEFSRSMSKQQQILITQLDAIKRSIEDLDRLLDTCQIQLKRA